MHNPLIEENIAALLLPPGPDPKENPPTPGEIQTRANFVKDMTKKAFDAYYKFTTQTSKKDASKGWFGRDHDRNMIASMPTLWIMDFKDEFENAKAWVENRFDVTSIQDEVIVAHVISDYIGGLLSCFALSENSMFLVKARKLADILEPVYQMAEDSKWKDKIPPTGLPYWKINPKDGKTSGLQVPLADVSTGALEYSYLSDITGDMEFRARVDVARQFLRQIKKPNGLMLDTIDVETGTFWSRKCSLFSTGLGYYYNLVKVNIQSGGQDTESLDQFKADMNAVFMKGLITSSKSGLFYSRDYDAQTEVPGDFMDYEGCSLGAMFALASHALQRSSSDDPHDHDEATRLFWHISSPIAITMHEAHMRSECRLAPRRIFFNDKFEARNEYKGHFYKQYLLLPELAESYFILWRMSHDQKWRRYAWELAQAIKEKCETKDGFAGADRIDQNPLKRFTYQPVHLLSATFKYLYLIFTDDSVIPLDQWVFNANGHPLPIRGQNRMYPKEKGPTAGH